METFLRKATAEDAKAIRKLIWSVRINPIALDWRRFLMAVDAQGNLIACGQIKPHRDGSLELASIAVVPKYRNQGIAARIIGALLAEAKLPIYLTCRAALESYYQKFGFVAVSYDQMPPYFKRITKIAFLLRRLSRNADHLSVMVKW